MMKLPLYFVTFLLFSFAASLQAANISLNIQTEANPGNADAGEGGISVATSALLTIDLTRFDSGATFPWGGNNEGDGSTVISLPWGWNLILVSVPAGGCLFSPTQFINQGNGIYNIRVSPSNLSANCVWLSGEYHYVVKFDRTSSSGDKTRGSGLGVLRIQ